MWSVADFAVVHPTSQNQNKLPNNLGIDATVLSSQEFLLVLAIIFPLATPFYMEGQWGLLYGTTFCSCSWFQAMSWQLEISLQMLLGMLCLTFLFSTRNPILFVMSFGSFSSPTNKKKCSSIDLQSFALLRCELRRRVCCIGIITLSSLLRGEFSVLWM